MKKTLTTAQWLNICMYTTTIWLLKAYSLNQTAQITAHEDALKSSLGYDEDLHMPIMLKLLRAK